MDNIFITYLIKASIALSIFYIFYMLSMRKDTFFKLRRYFFLYAVLFSSIFPFIKINFPNNNEIPIQIAGYWLQDIETGNAAAQSIVSNTINMQNILVFALISISILLGIRFIIQLLSIVNLKRKNEIVYEPAYSLVKVKDPNTSPFSFFKWIFINSDAHGEKEHAEIIIHEQVHVKQFHSIDVILYEILCICFWWNPFVWLLKKEMKINLEYLADEGVLNAGFDSREYQYLLLKTTNKNTGISLINNLNVSQLKKRITMMNKEKTFRGKAIKYLLAIPIGLFLVLGNAVQASSSDIISTFIEETSFEGKQNPQKKDGIYTVVDQIPSYPGGEKEQNKYLATNIKYPVEAQKNKIEGRVIVRFVVKSTGDISDINIIRGVAPSLDEEAIRIIKGMPKWIPGKQNGKAVDVYYTLPIVFRLSGSNKVTSSADNNNEVHVIGYDDAGDTPPPPPVQKKKDDSGHTYTVVEQMPSYPGGEKAMTEYLQSNMKYPEEAKAQGVQGRVSVRFIVGADGSIQDVNIVRGVSPELDGEAVRVIMAMPKWIPAKQSGKDVPVYFTLPIVFRLPKNDTKES